MNTIVDASVDDGGAEPSGSCYCYCGYNQAIGRCFNTSAGTTAAQCSAMRNATGGQAVLDAYCPRASVLYDCFELDADVSCPAKFPSSSTPGWILDPSKPATGCRTQAQVQASAGRGRGRAASTVDGPLQDAMQCHYLPTRYDECWFVPEHPCPDSPYFPLAPGGDE